MQLCSENGSNSTVHPELDNNSERNRASILGTTQGGTKQPAKSSTSPLGPKPHRSNATNLPHSVEKPGPVPSTASSAFRLAAPLKQSLSPPITPPLLPLITLAKFWRRQGPLPGHGSPYGRGQLRLARPRSRARAPDPGERFEEAGLAFPEG